MNIRQITIGCFIALCLLITMVFYQDISGLLRSGGDWVKREVKIKHQSYKAGKKLSDAMKIKRAELNKKYKGAVTEKEASVRSRQFFQIKEVAPEIETVIDFKYNDGLDIYIYPKKYTGIISQIIHRYEKNPINPKTVNFKKLRSAVASRDAGKGAIIK